MTMREQFESWWSLPVEKWLRRRDSDRHDVALEAWQAGMAAGVAEERERCEAERAHLISVAAQACGKLVSPQMMPLHECAAEPRHYPLPDAMYPGSKDWVAADYAGRVEWLHRMYEAKAIEADVWCSHLTQPDPIADSVQRLLALHPHASFEGEPVHEQLSVLVDLVETNYAKLPTAQPQPESQPEAEPVAWLYTFRRPGKWTIYASVDANERRDEITDDEWANRQMTPLAALKAQPQPEPVALDPLDLAILFHHTYERLAPSVGYDTRVETRVFDPESPNGKLMIAVCTELLPVLAAQAAKKS